MICDMGAMLTIGDIGDMGETGEMRGTELRGDRRGEEERGEAERASPLEPVGLAKAEGDFSSG